MLRNESSHGPVTHDSGTKKERHSVNKTVLRRLQLWNQGKLNKLLTGAKALRVRKSIGAERQSRPLKSLTNFAKYGKIGKAIRTLDSDAKGIAMSLKDKIGDETVAEILAEKQPKVQPINLSCLVTHEKANTLPFHNSIFDRI